MAEGEILSIVHSMFERRRMTKMALRPERSAIRRESSSRPMFQVADRVVLLIMRFPGPETPNPKP